MTTAAPASRVDRTALIAVLAGVAIVLGGWRDPVTLVAGVALGMGGVVLALRSRSTEVTPAARSSRSYLGGLLALVVTMALVRVVVAFLLDMQIGSLLADGASLSTIDAEARDFTIALRVLRDLEAFTSVVFLAAALWQYRRKAG